MQIPKILTYTCIFKNNNCVGYTHRYVTFAHVRIRTPDTPNLSAFDLCDLDTRGLARRIYETKKRAGVQIIIYAFLFLSWSPAYVLRNVRHREQIRSHWITMNFPWKFARFAMRRTRYRTNPSQWIYVYIFSIIIFHADRIQTASRRVYAETTVIF